MTPKKSAQVPLKITEKLKLELEAEAKREDRSRNWMAGHLIEEALAARARRRAKPKPKR